MSWITAAVMIVEIVGVVSARRFGVDIMRGAASLPASYSNTQELGRVLYTQYA